MLIKKVEVKTFWYTCQCDKCGGEYKATGETLLSSPPQYRHVCDICGDYQVFKVKYPYNGIEKF